MARRNSGNYRNCYGQSRKKATGRKRNCYSRFYLLDYWYNLMPTDVCGMCSLCRRNGIIIVEVVSEGMCFASPLIECEKA